MTIKLLNSMLFWILLIFFLITWSYTVFLFGSMAVVLTIAMVIFIIILAKIIKDPFWGVTSLIFFLPFERIPSIDIGSMNLKVNQILGGVTLISWILSLIFNKRKIMPNILAWSIIVFLTICFISLSQSGYLPRSLTVYIFIIFTILISLPVYNLIDSKEKLQKIIRIIFYSSLVVGIFAIWQFLGDLAGLPTYLTGLRDAYTKHVFGFPRVQAFSNEPLYLANFLLLPLGLSISLFLGKIYPIKKSIFFTLIIILILSLSLTVARSGYIGFIVMLLIILFVKFKKVFTTKNILIISSIIIIACGGTYWFLSRSETGSLDRFITRITLQDISQGDSTIGRINTYERALSYWQESPLIGIGIGNYAMRSKDYPPADEMKDWDIVNNEYIEILTETGVLGLASFIIIFMVLLWRSVLAYYRTNDELIKSIILGLSAALVAVLIQYNFFSTLYIVYFWVLVALIVATQNLCFKDNK
ncbi:MAG: O-antigen polymerase [uncultured bacterium]|nr:MAG: O-antigen polymerase [uncultured bacterium]